MLPLTPLTAGSEVSVLGAGWLGLPLAQYLRAQGYPVKAARTTAPGMAELESLGLEAFQVALAANTALPDGPFWHSPTLVVTIPPQRGRTEAEQLAQYGQLVRRLRDSGVRHVLYISSTSVYGEHNQMATEADPVAPVRAGGHIVYQLEQLLRGESAFQTTVLRFGGLIGYDRLPYSGTAILGRNRALDSPMNVIHRDDCVRICYEIVRQQAWGQVFNACADEHPIRREYYAVAARARGFALPDLGPAQPLPYKVVSSEKLKAVLGYQFLYPNPLTLVQESARESS
ncbi:MAG: SDR family oxidoreductase [Hymenobacter sp.]